MNTIASLMGSTCYAKTTLKQSFCFNKRCIARIPAARCRIAPGNAKTYTRHNDTSTELVRRERREGETPMRL